MPIGRYTPSIIVAVLPLLGALDYLLYYLGGNSATVSWVMLRVRANQPLAALATAYTLGLFCGHCFCPTFTPPPPYFRVTLARIVVSLAFTIGALIVISGAHDYSEAAIHSLSNDNQFHFALLLVASFAVGVTMGMFMLPQHPSAPPPAAAQ